MEGFGDPLFRNVTTPSADPLKHQEYNPTGIYRKSFTLPVMEIQGDFSAHGKDRLSLLCLDNGMMLV
jgi:hypothetical protein